MKLNEDFDGDDVEREGSGYAFEEAPPMFVDPETGCWIPLRRERTEKGYVRVSDGKGGLTRLHREMYARVYGGLKATDLVRHTCDRRDCINPMHLLKGTIQDNNADREARGRGCKGEDVGTSKLTNAQAAEIFTDDSLTIEEKAAKYGVCERSIRDILSGKTYKAATAAFRERSRPEASAN